MESIKKEKTKKRKFKLTSFVVLFLGYLIPFFLFINSEVLFGDTDIVDFIVDGIFLVYIIVFTFLVWSLFQKGKL